MFVLRQLPPPCPGCPQQAAHGLTRRAKNARPRTRVAKNAEAKLRWYPQCRIAFSCNSQWVILNHAAPLHQIVVLFKTVGVERPIPDGPKKSKGCVTKMVQTQVRNGTQEVGGWTSGFSKTRRQGYGSQLSHQRTAGFSLCFHFQGKPFWVTLLLTHIHNKLEADVSPSRICIEGAMFICGESASQGDLPRHRGVAAHRPSKQLARSV